MSWLGPIGKIINPVWIVSLLFNFLLLKDWNILTISLVDYKQGKHIYCLACLYMCNVGLYYVGFIIIYNILFIYYTVK